MAEFDPQVFVSREKLVVPRELDLDEEAIIFELLAAGEHIKLGSPEVMTSLSMMYFGMALGFKRYQEGAGGTVNFFIMDEHRKPTVMPWGLTSEGKPITPDSTDGYPVRPDQDTLLVVGDAINDDEFRILTGFVSTTDLAALRPESLQYVRMSTGGFLLRTFDYIDKN